MKKKIKKTFFFLILLPLGIHANDSIPSADFKKHCAKVDAYLLYSYTDVTYAKSYGNSYRRYVTISNKLVVNNSRGVDKFAFLNLTEYISNNLHEIDIKTLKADGTIVALDSSKVFQRKPNEKRFGSINYPIPSVEPGDTIETSYTYSKYIKIHEMTDFVNLYDNLPSLNTEYSIKSSPELSVRYKGYNNFPKPQIVSNDSLIYCVFKMEEIKGLVENQNTCLPCELPYMYYSMEKKGKKVRKWEDVYNQEFNVITQPMSLDNQNAAYYKKWKRSVLGQAKDSSKYYKFNLLLTDVINNINMKPTKESELIKSNGYFLKEKRFDPLSIRRLYRQILEDLDMQYWAVFARSKRAGNIDPYYIRKGEYDHIFFAYTNEKDNLNLLYPHEAYYKYQINEIPTSLYNTEAVIAKPYFTKKIKKKDKFIGDDFKLAQADSVTVNMIKLPGQNATHNQVKQVIYSEVNLEKKETPLKYKFSVSGGLYTDLKSFFELLAQNEEVGDYYNTLSKLEDKKEVISIDTITKTYLNTKKPFVYSMDAKGTLNEAVSFLNDHFINISLDKLIQHYQVESEQDIVDLNYYLDYSFTDHIMVILKFPKEVEVLDMDRYNADLKNDFGAYSFELSLTNNNQIILKSNYKINKEIIPKNAYKELKSINQLVKEVKNKRILVKLKNP